MTLLKPLWLNERYRAEDDRQLIASIWPGPHIDGGALVPTVNTMNAVVQPGTAVIPLTDGTSALVRWTGNTTFTVGAAPPAGQVRVESFYARVTSIDTGEVVIERLVGANHAQVGGMPTFANRPVAPANSICIGDLWIYPAITNLNTANNFPPGVGAVPPADRVSMNNSRTLALVKLTAAQQQVIFTNIPPNFRHLRLIVRARTNGNTGTAEGFAQQQMWLNNRVAANYISINPQAFGNTIDNIHVVNSTFAPTGNMPGSNAADTNTFAVYDMLFPFYSEPGPPQVKPYFTQQSYGQTDWNGNMWRQMHQWRFGRHDFGATTPIINTITLQPGVGSYVVNSTFQLFGIE